MVVTVYVKFPELFTPTDKANMFERIAEEASTEWKNVLIERKSLATGELVTSITGWNRENEAIVVGAFYGKFVDTGTNPFVPPYEPLWEWAFLKTHDPEEASALARSVQEKISQRGVLAQNISEEVMRRVDEKIDEIIETKLLKG